MNQKIKTSINQKNTLAELTNEELIAMVNELKNNTFEDDSPVRKFCEIKNPAYFMLALAGLTSQLCQILAYRLELTL